MADPQNPTQGNRQGPQTPQNPQEPNPNDADQTRAKERPMDDPGRGQGDRFDEKLPLREREGQIGETSRQEPDR